MGALAHLGLVPVAAAALLVAAGLWTLRTEAGAAWALTRVPGLTAEGVSGALLGDLQVQRLTITLPRGARSAIEGARWQGLRLALAQSGGCACR